MRGFVRRIARAIASSGCRTSAPSRRSRRRRGRRHRRETGGSSASLRARVKRGLSTSGGGTRVRRRTRARPQRRKCERPLYKRDPGIVTLVSRGAFDAHRCGSRHHAGRRRLRFDLLVSRASAFVVHAAFAHPSRPAPVVLGPCRALARSGRPARRCSRCPSLSGRRRRRLAALLARSTGRAGAGPTPRLVAAYHRSRLDHAAGGACLPASPRDRAARGPRRTSPKPRYRVWRHLPLFRRSGSSADRQAGPDEPSEAQCGAAPHFGKRRRLEPDGRANDQAGNVLDLGYRRRPSQRRQRDYRRPRRDHDARLLRAPRRRRRRPLLLPAHTTRPRIQHGAALRAAGLRSALLRDERPPPLQSADPLLRAALSRAPAGSIHQLSARRDRLGAPAAQPCRPAGTRRRPHAARADRHRDYRSRKGP